MTKDRNQHITTIIQKNPGIQFREIMRITGFKNGVLSHYLGKLEKTGTVHVLREPRQTRFYPIEIPDVEFQIIKNLRRQTPRKILHCLMLDEKGLNIWPCSMIKIKKTAYYNMCVLCFCCCGNFCSYSCYMAKYLRHWGSSFIRSRSSSHDHIIRTVGNGSV